VQQHTESLGRPYPSRYVLVAYQAASITLIAAVLLQAVLAGRGWFLDGDIIKVHGYVGNATFLLTMALAMLGRAATRSIRSVVPLALLVILTTVQIGLGYAGRDNATAAAWHVPNGVLIFGLSVLVGRSALRTVSNRRPSTIRE